MANYFNLSACLLTSFNTLLIAKTPAYLVEVLIRLSLWFFLDSFEEGFLIGPRRSGVFISSAEQKPQLTFKSHSLFATAEGPPRGTSTPYVEDFSLRR